MMRDLPTASGRPVNWTAVFALGTLLLLPATQTQAVPVAQTGVNLIVGTTSDSFNVSGDGQGAPVHREIDGTGRLPPAPTFFADATAAVGILSGFAGVSTVPDTNTHGGVHSIASYSVFDVFFSGPDPFVTTDMNTFINGSLRVVGDSGAGVIATIFLLPPGNPAGLFNGCEDIPQFAVCGAGIHFNLDLSNLHDALITTPRFRVPTGVNVELTMELDALAGANGRFGDDGALAESSFNETFSLPPTGPVFDLPAGFTVNSIQADIQDNRWLGAGPTPPLPEPSTLTLLGLGGAAMAAFVFAEALRKRRRAA